MTGEASDEASGGDATDTVSSATGSSSASVTTGNTGAAGADSAGSFVASESVARRLSRAELDNTLDTLLHDDTSPARQILSEDEHSPYDNDYTLQIASAALIDSLELLGTDVARRAVASDAFRDSL